MLFFLSKYLDKRLPVARKPDAALRLDFSDNLFSLQIPGDFENSASKQAGTLKIDIYSPATWTKSSVVELFKASWKYHQKLNIFDRGYGQLSMTVQVHRKVNSESDVFNYEHLAREITEQYIQKYGEINHKAESEAVVTTHIPIEKFYNYPDELNRFYLKKVNGQPWLMHNVVGRETHTVYNLPITDTHFLWVDFHFQPFEFRGDWELCETAGAEKDVQAIVDTFDFKYATAPSLNQLQTGAIKQK